MPRWAQQQQQTERGKQPAQTGKQITAAQRKQLADRLAKLETNSEKED